VPGQVGLIQATEAIKLILKKGKPLIGQFLIYNSLDMDFRTFSIKKNSDCPLCNSEPKIRELAYDDDACSIHPVAGATV
jgi:molybdopterin/thiamine biosynthesis adenylyltransferase